MSDYARRAFRMKLGTIMEAVMKTAVCEIANIFEGSMCEQQLELSQRIEEISVLRGKLEKAERRLRGDAEEAKRISAVELRVDMETFSKNITMMTDPDIQDVPDYWCAPVQSDEQMASSSTGVQESVCPSVRLKPLTVALWRMPDVKQEVDGHLMPALTSPGIRIKADCGLKDRLRDSIQQFNPPLSVAGYACGQQQAMLGRIKQEERESTINSAPKHKRRQKLKRHTRSQRTNPPRMKLKFNQGETTYKCQICERFFYTEVGLKVHAWLHKKCPNCQEVFTFPSTLQRHFKMCHRVKEETITTEIVSPTSPLQGTPSANTPKKHTCKFCPRKFCTKASLNTHVTDYHDGLWEPGGRNVPFEEHGMSTTSHRRKHRNQAALSMLNPKTKTKVEGNVLENLGRGVSNDYKCTVCKKPFRSKSRLKKHMTLHTGVQAFQCRRCDQSFRLHANLSRHYRICTGPESLSLQCEDCSTTYANQKLLNRHMMDVHNRKSHTCKICGKDFAYTGTLREHYRRIHNR